MRYWPRTPYAIFIMGVLTVTACNRAAAADAPAQSTVIVIPGIMGSLLRDASSNSLAWVNELTVARTYPCSQFLLPLTLAPDGHSPVQGVTYTCSDTGQTTTVNGTPVKVDGLLAGGGSPLELIPDKYGRLISTLRADYNVVPFAYDWRLDYEAIADQLRQQIENLTKNGGKLDIVAHSQGGLIARLYLSKFANDPRVGTVIFLGTPQLGAPKSFAILSGWESFESYYGAAVFGLNFDTGAFVTRTFPATYELLPQFNFFTTAGNAEPFASSFGRLPNHGLVAESTQLSAEAGQRTPAGVKLFAINGSGQNTLSGLQQSKADGCILPVDDVKGDGTVPLNSATALAGVQPLFVEVEHSDLPNSEIVRQTVKELLKTGSVGGLTPDPRRSATPFSTDHIVVHTCGPLHLNVYDTAGRIAGMLKQIFTPQIPNSEFFRFASDGNDAAMLPLGNTSLCSTALAKGRQHFPPSCSLRTVSLSFEHRLLPCMSPSSSRPYCCLILASRNRFFRLTKMGKGSSAASFRRSRSWIG